jgi:hypothetical protein
MPLVEAARFDAALPPLSRLDRVGVVRKEIVQVFAEIVVVDLFSVFGGTPRRLA